MRKRAEHLELCKQRALKYVDEGSLQNAFSSFQSDMAKHPETKGHIALDMGTVAIVFRGIMDIMVKKGYASKIVNGRWKILIPDKC